MGLYFRIGSFSLKEEMEERCGKDLCTVSCRGNGYLLSFPLQEPHIPNGEEGKSESQDQSMEEMVLHVENYGAPC